MPSILPPDTDKQDQDSLSVLDDLAPPCEYSVHRSVGSGPAEWIAWFRPDGQCSCDGTTVKLFCDPCWTFRNSTGFTWCKHDIKRRASSDILRVERL